MEVVGFVSNFLYFLLCFFKGCQLVALSWQCCLWSIMVDAGELEIKFAFDEASESLMDMETETGAPAAPPPPHPCSPPRKKARKSNEGKGNKAKDDKTCKICEEEPCVPKFNFCKACKKDVQSCQNSAKAEGREEDFKRLSRTLAGLKHLISHYKLKCQVVAKASREIAWIGCTTCRRSIQRRGLSMVAKRSSWTSLTSNCT